MCGNGTDKNSIVGEGSLGKEQNWIDLIYADITFNVHAYCPDTFTYASMFC